MVPADTVPGAAGQLIGPDGTWPLNSASGPCRTWPMESGCGCLPPDATTWDELQIHSVEVATEILWRLTAGRFGLCRELVRPCGAPCRPEAPGGRGFHPDLRGGRWVNVSCGCAPERARDDCSCGTAPSELFLPGPVYWEDPRIDPENPHRYRMHVWVDGQELTGGKYWMTEPNRLFRTDGGTWPRCQDMAAAPDAEGAFSILYWRGVPVPPGGRRAVALLACEIWRACQGSESCALPRRVETVQREGVTYTMVDPLDFLNRGRTGLTEVDMWLGAVNPSRAHSPSAVLTPDRVAHRSEWMGGSAPPWYSPPPPADTFGKWGTRE